MSASLVALTDLEIETFFPDEGVKTLERVLGECRVVDCEGLSGEKWREFLAQTNPKVLVAGWKTPRLPDDTLERLCPNLDYLCYLTGSVRKVVSRDLIEQGLRVSNWGSSISRTVAECALLLALACGRRLAYWNEQMHNQGGWKDAATVTHSLFGRRVGIHGYGNIARFLISLLKPFSEDIVVYSDAVPSDVFKNEGVECVDSLEELFRGRDVVFELEALTPERKGIVDESLLRSISNGGIFVNVARGELVDEPALLRVAQEGRLQVGLDVYAVEPLPKDHPFRGCYGIVMLPHIAGPTTDRRRDAGDHALRNLERYMDGAKIESPVTLEVFDRST